MLNKITVGSVWKDSVNFSRFAIIYGITRKMGTIPTSKTLAAQTPTAVQLFQGGLFGDSGNDSDGNISFLIGGDGRFSG